MPVAHSHSGKHRWLGCLIFIVLRQGDGLQSFAAVPTDRGDASRETILHQSINLPEQHFLGRRILRGYNQTSLQLEPTSGIPVPLRGLEWVKYDASVLA
jgi:hypothetical protein